MRLPAELLLVGGPTVELYPPTFADPIGAKAASDGTLSFRAM